MQLPSGVCVRSNVKGTIWVTVQTQVYVVTEKNEFFLVVTFYFMIEYNKVYDSSVSWGIMTIWMIKERLGKGESMEVYYQSHFIFNALSCIRALTVLRPNEAEDAVMALTDYLRITTLDSLDIWIPLEQEMDGIEGFLKLEKLRFSRKFSYEMNVQTIDMNIPPLTIECYVEALVRYSVLQQASGCISVMCFEQEDGVVVEIWNDGIALDCESDLLDANTKKLLQHANKKLEELFQAQISMEYQGDRMHTVIVLQKRC